ncbi:MAG: transcription antitermination factor NusB [Actinomycetota bacterium]
MRRRGARKLALDVLYEHEISERPLEEILERYVLNPAYEFSRILVLGVGEHAVDIDQTLAENSTDWTIDRMPPIDRSLLRLALFEMMYLDDVPSAVAISEAVELAKIYSTDESSGFINGVLGKVASVIT